jgi:hypothetical protein
VATSSLLLCSTKSSHENRRRRVAGLGGGGRQVEAQRVGVVLAQKVGHLHEGAMAFTQLRALEVEVFMVARDKNWPDSRLSPTVHLWRYVANIGPSSWQRGWKS